MAFPCCGWLHVYLWCGSSWPWHEVKVEERPEEEGNVITKSINLLLNYENRSNRHGIGTCPLVLWYRRRSTMPCLVGEQVVHPPTYASAPFHSYSLSGLGLYRVPWLHSWSDAWHCLMGNKRAIPSISPIVARCAANLLLVDWLAGRQRCSGD